jgi:hypothetical protein
MRLLKNIAAVTLFALGMVNATANEMNAIDEGITMVSRAELETSCEVAVTL